MADNLLSKITISGTTYTLKDADYRALMDNVISVVGNTALGTTALTNIATSISDGDGAVANAATVKAYVDAQIGTIHKFDVQIYDTLPTASSNTMYILALVEASAQAGTYIEYITVRSGSEGSYSYAWEQIGSTAIDLSGYVQKTTTIAGVDLEDNISQSELQTALNLGTLAYSNTATGTVAAQTITGVEATGTPNGSIAVTLTQSNTAASLTTADYTPSGSITGSAISGGSIEVSLTNAASTSTATLTTASITPTGNVSTPSITVTPTTGTIQPVSDVGSVTTIDTTKFDGGKAATWTGASYTAPSLGTASTSTFAKSGLVINTSNIASEELIFEAADTESAVTAQGTFSQGSLDWGTFDGGDAASLAEGFYTVGSVPTLGTAQSFMTGASAALDSAPQFTGDSIADAKVTKVEYYQQAVDSATFQGTAASLGFSGTKVAGALVTGVNYDKATVDTATFTGASTSFDVGDIAVSQKSVTVEPNND